jgi:steroid delta-isomerase-like uncharacterized protein
MFENNKNVSRRIIEEIWNKKNPTLMNELYASNCVVHTPEGELKGTKRLREFYDTYLTAFPDFHIKLDYLIAEDDKVMTAYTFTGTHKGRLMDISPTGKQVAVKGMAIGQIAEGKVVEERNLWDTLSLMEQLGAVPVHEHAWK